MVILKVRSCSCRWSRDAAAERLLRSLLPMQSESLTTSNCPAWPVGAVKSEREQTTRRPAISSGTARGALTPGGLTFATAAIAGGYVGRDGASLLRSIELAREMGTKGRRFCTVCCILDDVRGAVLGALNYDN